MCSDGRSFEGMVTIIQLATYSSINEKPAAMQEPDYQSLVMCTMIRLKYYWNHIEIYVVINRKSKDFNSFGVGDPLL